MKKLSALILCLLLAVSALPVSAFAEGETGPAAVRAASQHLGKLRRVITLARSGADLKEAAMSKPLTMLLFGMINWMFTWMKPEGPVDYDAMAPIVADLFLGGLGAVQVPAAVPASLET